MATLLLHLGSMPRHERLPLEPLFGRAAEQLVVRGTCSVRVANDRETVIGGLHVAG